MPGMTSKNTDINGLTMSRFCSKVFSRGKLPKKADLDLPRRTSIVSVNALTNFGAFQNETEARWRTTPPKPE